MRSEADRHLVDLACKNGNFFVPTLQVCQQPNEPFDHALEVEKELMTEPPFLTFCIRGLLAGHPHCHVILIPLTENAEDELELLDTRIRRIVIVGLPMRQQRVGASYKPEVTLLAFRCAGPSTPSGLSWRQLTGTQGRTPTLAAGRIRRACSMRGEALVDLAEYHLH
jgi:hypothetical protein